jgi:hypothetical protein
VRKAKRTDRQTDRQTRWLLKGICIAILGPRNDPRVNILWESLLSITLEVLRLQWSLVNVVY